MVKAVFLDYLSLEDVTDRFSPNRRYETTNRRCVKSQIKQTSFTSRWNPEITEIPTFIKYSSESLVDSKLFEKKRLKIIPSLQ